MNNRSAFINELSDENIVKENEEEKHKELIKELKRKRNCERQRAFYQRQKDLKKKEEKKKKKVPKTNAERQREFRQRKAEKFYVNMKRRKLCSNEENVVQGRAVENIEHVTLQENQFHSQQLHIYEQRNECITPEVILHRNTGIPGDGNVQKSTLNVPDKQLDLKSTDYRCNECNSDIFGFRYVCVQCVDHDVCATCEARGEHALHYVLRAPADKPHHEVMAVLEKIREIINIERQEDQDVPLDELESVKCEIETLSDPLGDGNVVKIEIKEEPLEISEFEHAPLTDEEATIEGNAQSAEPKKLQQRRKRKAPSDTHTDTPPVTLPDTQFRIPLDRVTEVIAKRNKTQSSRERLLELARAPSSSKTLNDPTPPTYEELPDTKPMTFDPEPGSVVPVFMNNILKCEDRAGFQPYQMHTSATSSSQPLVVSFIEPLQPARDLVIKTELPD